MFAILGMEIFSGKLSFNSTDPHDCGNDLLIGSEFSRMGYCNINFNDIFHSFVTLFVLTVVNQWHDILFYKKYLSYTIFIYFRSIQGSLKWSLSPTKGTWLYLSCIGSLLSFGL